jgi:tetratricopeptide (TPR) repeat protein
MANFDNRDLPISTASDAAAEHYRAGVSLLLGIWPSAAEPLDAAIAADPDFALAHAARARLHALRAEPAEARVRIAEAERLVARNGTERERSHVEVLVHSVNNRPKQALAQTLAHADRWPRDAMILALPLGAFGLFAFSGMADHDQARVDLCERHARQYGAGDWWFLTYHGWSLAENGSVARGRAMLEHAFALNAKNANVVHALVHAHFEAGEGDDAAKLIAGWLPGYDRSGILHGHMAWHGALLALERGDADAALAIYADQVQPAVSKGVPLNIVSDAASLLWRLGAYGYEVPNGLWQQVSDYADQAFPKAGNAFADAHMLMIAAAIGNGAALNQRVAELDAMVAAGLLGAGAVVPAIGRAALAFAKGNLAECVRLLEPLAAEVVRIGGSGAQREVIEDTLLVALMRSGETEKARALLDRRLHRRPSPRDARWRDQLIGRVAA